MSPQIHAIYYIILVMVKKNVYLPMKMKNKYGGEYLSCM